jgi:hypothetical protein
MINIDNKTIAEQAASGIRAFISHVTKAFRRLLTIPQPTRLPAGADAWPANCSNIIALLSHLCDFDDARRQWVLRWLAFQLRNPGAKMSTALILNGGEGSGKTLFLRYVVADLFGESAVHLSSNQLRGAFNGWAATANMVAIDGEFTSAHLSRLKTYIASPEVLLVQRGFEPRVIPNTLNFVFVTSERDFMPRELAERRFTVLEVPPARESEFYCAVLHQLANGGLEAFRHYLLHGVDMGTFNESTLPPAAKMRKCGEAA